jgi:uncharacterized Zn-binding protein involved in type VI secretion
MTAITRFYVREGDTTTAQGRIEARPQAVRVTYGDDKQATVEGDPVWCPACKTYGVTQCVQPYLPMTDPTGRQLNLDGDLCVCGCRIPPRLVALKQDQKMTLPSTYIAKMPGSDGWLAHAGLVDEVFAAFDQHFVVTDKTTGKPASGFAYGIKTPDGEYHDELNEEGATTKARADEPQSVTLEYVVQTKIGI